MAEFARNALQTVLFDSPIELDTVIPCRKGYIVHREGSGLLTLRGSANQCFATYFVTFNANIAIATGEEVGPISLSLAIDGENVLTSQAIVTPAAIGDFWNVSFSEMIQIPRGCCELISVRNNTASQASIDVQNANLIVSRTA